MSANCLAGQRLSSRPFGLDDLLDQADDVIRVENGEIGLEADQLRMTPQQLDADRVEGAEPWHAFDGAADQNADTLFHFAGGLVGKGHSQDLAWPGFAERQDMRDAGGQNARLARTGTSQDEHRTFRRFNRQSLFRIEPAQVGWRSTRLHGACGYTRRLARWHIRFVEKWNIVR